MKVLGNRVLLAFKSWEERKKEIEPLMKAGAADTTTIARLQMDHLRQARHRLRQSARPDEKPFMILLENQVAKLEKQLYPKLLFRIISQFKDRLISGPAYLQQQERQRADNMENLKTQLKEAGYGTFAGKLEQHLDPDQKQIRLPLTCQLGMDKRMNLDLQFDKDAYGYFQLNRVDGALLHHDQVIRAQTFELNEWPNLKTNQIWSLLEGRALKQQYTDASGHENHRWVELGQKSIQHYDHHYGFDIKAALGNMPGIVRNKDELARYLENGQQIPTYWKQGRQFQQIYVQADPANRTIQLLDDKLQPTTAEKLNQKLAQQVPKVKPLSAPVQKTRKGVKNGHRQ
jgi:hypothetical protein